MQVDSVEKLAKLLEVAEDVGSVDNQGPRWPKKENGSVVDYNCVLVEVGLSLLCKV